MIRKLSWAFPLVLLLALSAISLNAQPKPTQNPSSAYVNLLQRARNGDATVDFKELRFAYTETADYNPYGGAREERQKMFTAIEAKQFEQVRELAEIILAKNYLDLNGQFGAFVAYRNLGNRQKATLHKFLFDGLVHSIENSGDGKTPETAFVVISVDEEYVLLNWMGMRPAGQDMINQNGHSYDRMKAVDPKTNQTVAYYFNIDKPFNWLGKKLKMKV